MKKIITILTVMTSVLACGQSRLQSTITSNPQFHLTFLDVVYDSSATWKDITNAAQAFVDSLIIIANDEANLDNRLAGQQWGYVTIDVLLEKYYDMEKHGIPVVYEDLNPLMAGITEAASVWFYTDDDKVPNIWRDHYYRCYQNSDNPIDDYYHIMVTLPSETMPEPSLQIFFPDAAEKEPGLVFTNNKSDGSGEEDLENMDIISISKWIKNYTGEEGLPMHADLGADIVKKMLSHSYMYITFQSRMRPEGDPLETEIARINLDSFQAKWSAVTNK